MMFNVNISNERKLNRENFLLFRVVEVKGSMKPRQPLRGRCQPERVILTSIYRTIRGFEYRRCNHVHLFE